MTTETIFYILIAGVVALALAIFMYGYKSKSPKRLCWTFGVLRFLTLFTLLILIINPKLESETYFVEKPKLPILIDNSFSVTVLEQGDKVLTLVEKIQRNNALNEKFDVSYFSFGSKFQKLDTLNFDEKQTQIAKPLASIHQLYKNQIAPAVLITDGNQTLGTDYEFEALKFKNEIYPVILGDSIKHTDLKIEQLNTNRYAYLKNRFPVETILTYSGQESVRTEFVVRRGNTIVYRESVAFSENLNSKTINFELVADNVGLQKYTAELLPLENEKNKTNNSKHFAVEVIDQATHVLIISDMLHPDIGSLKKSITSNEQRKVAIVNPKEAVAVLDDYQLLILYQPNNSFRQVFKGLEKLAKNTFIITGLQTDWSFLNRVQPNFIKKATRAKDDVQGRLNSNFGYFVVEDLGFDSFPPLHTLFGTVQIQEDHEVMLEQTVGNLSNDNPLFTTFEIDNRRHALWDGEGFWRWRAQSYLKEDSFKNYDDFIGNIVQYLASNKRRSRLEVFSESFYYNSNPVKISAQFFDKNYVFDRRAGLQIQVKNLDSEKVEEFPLLLRNNYYEVDLSNLAAGEYAYTVTNSDENISKSGSFVILEFNVEQQFLNADIPKLERIAENSGGNSYFVDETEQLIQDLIENPKFKNIQKSEQKTIPLIDWKYLLAILAVLLATEWFIRKYNGLI